jgi:hypothetical protein
VGSAFNTSIYWIFHLVELQLFTLQIYNTRTRNLSNIGGEREGGVDDGYEEDTKYMERNFSLRFIKPRAMKTYGGMAIQFQEL